MGYLEHWGLFAPPFSDDAPYVPLASAETALAKLRHGAVDGGTAALSGGEGLGKTRLARRLVDEFADAGWVAVYLPRPTGAAGDWLARLDPDGRTPRRPGQSDFSVLEDRLRALYAAGRRALVAVDDMQTARDPTAGDLLRALHNIVVDGHRAVHLLLAGATGWPGRAAMVDGLASFCAVRAALRPLTAEECRYYLLGRLSAAGAGRGVMTRRAADAMGRAARGVPRDLNRLADLALVTGYGLGMAKVTPDLAEMAAADLGLPADRADWSADAFEGVEPPEPVLENAAEEPDILAMLAAAAPAERMDA